MPANTRHIYRHADGREVSLTEAGFDEFYGPDSGFKQVRPETEDDFIATGIPKPRRNRTKPKSKKGRPAPAAPMGAPEPAVTPEGAAEDVG